MRLNASGYPTSEQGSNSVQATGLRFDYKFTFRVCVTFIGLEVSVIGK